MADTERVFWKHILFKANKAMNLPCPLTSFFKYQLLLLKKIFFLVTIFFFARSLHRQVSPFSSCTCVDMHHITSIYTGMCKSQPNSLLTYWPRETWWLLCSRQFFLWLWFFFSAYVELWLQELKIAQHSWALLVCCCLLLVVCLFCFCLFVCKQYHWPRHIHL